MGPPRWGQAAATPRAGSHADVLWLSSSLLCSDSGVGAGIDSYYEYLMKAYILLGDNVFLDRFNVVSPVCLYWTLGCCPLCPIIYWPTYMCATALQCHYEVHQPASSAAQRAHAQSHRECSQLDGLSPGLLPRPAGQERSLMAVKPHRHVQRNDFKSSPRSWEETWNQLSRPTKCSIRSPNSTSFFQR